MTHQAESLEMCVTESIRLRTDFVWRGDRYAHAVTLINPQGEHLLLESVEGDPQDPWPPSPAFQQLSMQGDGAQRVAFLVGMAGKSHWSMSVEVASDQRSIVFDVACRIHLAADRLCSSYRAPSFEINDPATAVAEKESWYCRLKLDPTLPQHAQMQNLPAGLLRMECLAVPGTLPGTARWKYAVTVADV